MDPVTLAFSLGVLCAAAAIQGVLGFGFGIVAMTALAFGFDIIHASGVVNLTGLLVSAGMLWRLRTAVLWSVAGRIIPGIVAGVGIGVFALGTFDADLLLRSLGVVVMGLAAWNLAAVRLASGEPPLWLDLGVGVIGGTLGGAFNTGGPPIIAHLYRRPEGPDALRGTLQALFLSISLVRAPVAASQGLMDAAVWENALWGIPAVILGQAGGAWLAKHVPAERFRKIAWAGLGVLGAALLIRGSG